MDLNHLHIVSPDPAASVEYYRKYFGFRKEKKLEGGSYFIFNEEGFMIAIEKSEGPLELPNWYHHGFRLPSKEKVVALHSRLKSEGQPIAGELKTWDDFVVFRARDPGGFPVEVYWETEPAEAR